MATFGTVGGVTAYARHVTLDQPGSPTAADIETWLVGRSAQLTGWLAAAGYVVPITQAEAKAALDRYANLGAACDLELSLRLTGMPSANEQERQSLFCSQFNEAQAWIAGGALGALGVVKAATTTAQMRTGVILRGTDYNGRR